MEERIKVGIIGAGPAGLTAGIYLSRAGIQCKIFDPGAPGGTVFMVHEIDNYPGFPEGINGRALASLMEKQARKYGVEIVPIEVSKVERAGDNFLLALGSGDKAAAEAVVAATGCRPKRLGIKGEAALFGKGVSYCAVCDGFFFKGQDVAVVGGGDSAVQEALYLSQICRKVYIVHRRDQLRAKKLHQDRASAKNNIEMVYNAAPEMVLGQERVSGLQVKDVKSGEQKVLSVSGVFFYVGLTPINEPVLGLVHLTEDGFIRASEDTRTNVPGIFAAGDIRKKSSRQVSTAVADGCNAAAAIEEYLLEKE